MSVLFIANIRMRDETAYARYLESCDEVFARFSGRYLAVAEPPRVLEGSYPYTKTVVIEFPDRSALEAWYYSPEYQAILAHRLAGADCDTIAVDLRER